MKVFIKEGIGGVDSATGLPFAYPKGEHEISKERYDMIKGENVRVLEANKIEKRPLKRNPKIEKR